ncbi:hypothetical protein Tco_1464510, partial [Tanacetum coccineum]
EKVKAIEIYPEQLELIYTFHACKQEGQSVSSYVLTMKSYLEQLEHLNYVLPHVMSFSLILNSLSKDFEGFMRNYNMHSIGKTIIFSTWMAFGENTRDLGSFGEEMDEITDLHQILEEMLIIGRGDGVASIKRRRHDPSSDGVRDLVTESGRGRLNKDLESST